MNGINRFSLDAILIFDENFDIEIKNTLLKCDAILYDDEYWDIEIGFYPDLDKIYINTDNTVYHNTELCRYYGIQYFYQWENLYFQDLVCCTFDNLGGGGQVNNCINPCDYYLNTPFNLLTNVRIEDLFNCKSINN